MASELELATWSRSVHRASANRWNVRDSSKLMQAATWPPEIVVVATLGWKTPRLFPAGINQGLCSITPGLIPALARHVESCMSDEFLDLMSATFLDIS